MLRSKWSMVSTRLFIRSCWSITRFYARRLESMLNEFMRLSRDYQFLVFLALRFGEGKDRWISSEMRQVVKSSSVQLFLFGVDVEMSKCGFAFRITKKGMYQMKFDCGTGKILSQHRLIKKSANFSMLLWPSLLVQVILSSIVSRNYFIISSTLISFSSWFLSYIFMLYCSRVSIF